METKPQYPMSRTRPAIGARFATATVLVALAALSGCSSGGASPKVTVTITPTVESPSATPEPEPPNPEPTDPQPQPEPEPEYTPSPLPPSGDVTLVASKGGVSPGCSGTTCWYPHLEWTGLEVGSHRVQCVSSVPGVGIWSDNTYYFDTEDGERELKCFVGYSGSTVWVVIDEVYESNHADW